MDNTKVQEWYNQFKPAPDFRPLTNLIARGKTVYIKKENRETVLKNSGIIIQNSGQSAVLPVGRVYGVGPLVPDLKPGMRVYYNFYANTVVFHDGVEYLMISELDVFGVLPDEAVVMEQTVSKEGLRRTDLSVDEMPNQDLSKEEKVQFKEMMAEETEAIKKDVKKKIIITPK